MLYFGSNAHLVDPSSTISMLAPDSTIQMKAKVTFTPNSSYQGQYMKR